MKHAVALVVGSLVLTGGCTRWGFLKNSDGPKGDPGKVPSIPALVKYLNDNSSRMQTIRCTELDMTCSVGLQSFGIRGRMMAQQPRNFLLAADAFAAREVDLGSNDQEFWWWIKRNEPPYQFYCSYKDLAGGQVRRIPFPFQPDWIIDALGMGKYGPAERYKMEVAGERLKLVEKTVSPQGQPVRKVIVMNRYPVKAPRPQITDFLLLDDASGKEICSAHITQTQIDDRAPRRDIPNDTGGKGGILPRKIEFQWSMPNNQKLSLAMTLDGLTMNPDIPAVSFARQPLRGVPSYDLATGRLDNGTASLQPVQGFNGSSGNRPGENRPAAFP